MSGGRRKREPGKFARLPDEVLTSAAWTTLRHSARSTLTALAAQHLSAKMRGERDSRPANGYQRLTPEICERYGLNRAQASRDAAVLIERGLIVRTCPGGKRPRPPTQYALAWRPITHERNELLDELKPPTEKWKKWKPTATSELRNRSERAPRKNDVAKYAVVVAQNATSKANNVAKNAADPPSDVAKNANLSRNLAGGGAAA